MNLFDLEGDYIVYQHPPNESVYIHQRECRQVIQYGGVSKDYPPNTWYVGPLHTFRAAQWNLDA